MFYGNKLSWLVAVALRGCFFIFKPVCLKQLINGHDHFSHWQTIALERNPPLRILHIKHTPVSKHQVGFIIDNQGLLSSPTNIPEDVNNTTLDNYTHGKYRIFIKLKNCSMNAGDVTSYGRIKKTQFKISRMLDRPFVNIKGEIFWTA